MNNWKSVWNKRDIVNLRGYDSVRTIIMEQKRVDGYDVLEGGLSYEALNKQFSMIEERLSSSGECEKQLESLFEVGCGSGPNLLYFQRKDILVGGVDYSEPMICMANKVLSKCRELYVDEAVNLDTKIKYDAILSNGVFSYFESLKYAYKVLEKMLDKTFFSLGILDVHDEKKREDYLNFRRNMIEDYDEKYMNLDKLFYSKELFINFAEEHGLKLDIYPCEVDGYWNNDYVFDVFMYKQ